MNFWVSMRIIVTALGTVLLYPAPARASDIRAPVACASRSVQISKHTMNILRQMYEGLDVEHDLRLTDPDPSNLFWQNQIRLGYVTYSCRSGTPPEAAALPSPFPEDPCNHDAHVVRAAPPSATSLKPGIASGVVLVNVAIDGAGKTSGVTVASTPSVALDAAAIDAASRSFFAPKLRNCKIVPTTLLYAVLVGG